MIAIAYLDQNENGFTDSELGLTNGMEIGKKSIRINSNRI